MSALILDRIRDRLLYDVLGHVPHDRPFIFGIGLSKTGTTSLNDALEILGYSAFHLPPIARVTPQSTIVMDWPWWVYKYEALTDLTVAILHRELAKVFPNALFIYTHRARPAWLRSCEKHFTAELIERRIAQGQPYLNALTTAVYGSRVFDTKKFSDAYVRHEADVLSLHDGKSNFLSYDLTSGEGWGPLCNFLNKPIPDHPFPTANRSARPDQS